MKTFGRIFFIAVISTCLMGCPTSQLNKEAAWKNEIMKTDSEFSKASSTRGMKKAFIDYMDNDGILLRPNHLPIIGANAIEYLSEQTDTSFTLTWEPSSARVSASGDLGYSYGIYHLQLQDTILKGTYVSIWEKQEDGNWKFVLDSGNPGIAAKDSVGK